MHNQGHIRVDIVMYVHMAIAYFVFHFYVFICKFFHLPYGLFKMSVPALPGQ